MNALPYVATWRWPRHTLAIAFGVIAQAGLFEFACAQDYAPLVHPGARIRVWVADTTRVAASSGESASSAAKSKRLIASFVEFGHESMTLRRHGGEEPATIALGYIRRLEVSQGRHSKAGSGAKIGLWSGIAAGAAAGLIVCDDGGCEEAEGSNDYTALVSTVFALGGGLVGAGLGALTGSFLHTEDWRVVPLPNARLGLRSAGGDGVRVTLTLPFDPRQARAEDR